MVSGETIRRVLVVLSCGLVLSACGQSAQPSFVAGSPAPSASSAPPAGGSAGPLAAAERQGSSDIEARVLGAQFPPMTPEVEAFASLTAAADGAQPTAGAASPDGSRVADGQTALVASTTAPAPSREHSYVQLIPASGPRTFTSASGGTTKVGDGSTLVTYKVQVEGGTLDGWTPTRFAAKVDQILADTRSWRAAHTWSFQRVGSGTTPSVYIRLATRDTVDYYCGLAGVDTEGKYSCRYGKYVMINLNRWLLAVPGFGVDLEGYRAMVINHELGHFLGYHHQACPAPGQLAPVMQTQTIALNGCLPNSWPYPDGVHFVSGPPAPA